MNHDSRLGKKRLLKKLAVYLLICAVGLVAAELAVRTILFTDVPLLGRLRNPDIGYADRFSDDDFWKMYYRLGGRYKPPEDPHPELGWVGDFSRDDYLHHETGQIKHRRPVLLYGDSFAQGVDQAKRFQAILNSDAAFSQDHYLLNYGVGGYGFGQTYSLFKKSIDHFEDPRVIISLLTLDLDRTILSFRTGQKPTYRVEDDQLVVCGTPVFSDPNEYMAANPVQIKSYLYRLLLASGVVPGRIVSFLRQEKKYIAMKKQVNERIFQEILKELEDRNLDYLFVVFHCHWPGSTTLLDGEDDWRDNFLRELMEKYQVPYIWAKDLYQRDTEGQTDPAIDRYILPNDGHPTTYFNQLIATEIKKAVLEPATRLAADR